MKINYDLRSGRNRICETYSITLDREGSTVRKNLELLDKKETLNFVPILWRVRAGKVTKFQKENPIWRSVSVKDNKDQFRFEPKIKLPGCLVLTYTIKESGDLSQLYQQLAFQPAGLWGHIYWWISYPLHYLIFRGQIKKILQHGSR